MKRLFFFGIIILMAFSMQAQKCAVLEFRGAQSVSVSDIDGISEMFMTYFRPAGYTMVERAQIDKVISEQGFQRSNLTDAQAVKVGRILNVSKVVVGKVSRLGGQYQVDVRVVDVVSGHDVALEGSTFSGDYRTNVRNLATKLAEKIAITSGNTVPHTELDTSKVKLLYGYLKIFPNDLGIFQEIPYSVINMINQKKIHGDSTWRLPTKEEMALMRSNNILGNGKYWTIDGDEQGSIRLVTDGRSWSDVRNALLEKNGWVVLDVPQGHFYKNKNEGNKEEDLFRGWDMYINEVFQKHAITKEEMEVIILECQWEWIGNGYKVTAPNGKYIIFKAYGYYEDGKVYDIGKTGVYWLSTSAGWGEQYVLKFTPERYFITTFNLNLSASVRF